MKEILATPGPCPVPPQALKELSEPVAHHRTEEFKEMFFQVRERMREIFQTKNDVLLHSASGTGAMESLLVNLHSPGEKVLCLTAGKFGSRWVELAEAYGLTALEVKAPWGQSPSPGEISQALKQHPDIKSVFVQACETSTGQRHPIKEYADVLKSSDALLLVDGITALGAYDLPMDSWGLDGVIGGSQKAFMAPTGLSFISLSQRAWKAHERAKLPRYYFDLGPERSAQTQLQTRFSSAVSLIKSLNASLEVMTKAGLSAHFEETERRARFAGQVASTLGMSLFPQTPSPSLSVLSLQANVSGEKLQAHIQKSYGVVFMGGQDELKGKVIRWGHMGHQPPEDQVQIAEALMLGLKDLGALEISEAEGRSAIQSLAKATRLV